MIEVLNGSPKTERTTQSLSFAAGCKQPACPLPKCPKFSVHDLWSVGKPNERGADIHIRHRPLRLETTWSFVSGSLICLKECIWHRLHKRCSVLSETFEGRWGWSTLESFLLVFRRISGSGDLGLSLPGGLPPNPRDRSRFSMETALGTVLRLAAKST